MNTLQQDFSGGGLSLKPLPVAPPKPTPAPKPGFVAPAPIQPTQPVQQPGYTPATSTGNSVFDPGVIALAKAIRQQETGNRNISGSSGESGRYQWLPGTWASAAGKYLGNPNADKTLENENFVMASRIKDWKAQGYTPNQIASMHNAGEGRPNAYKENWKGVNSQGVAYDTPGYAAKVAALYEKYKAETPAAPQTNVPAQPMTAAGFGGNVITSGLNLIGGFMDALIHPVKTVGTLASAFEGLVQNIAGEPIARALGIQGQLKQTKEQQIANAIGKYYVDRYGSIDAFKKSAYEDPLGVLLDASMVLDAGGSIAGKVGDITKAAAVTDGLSALEAGTDASKARSIFNAGQKISDFGGAVTDAGNSINPLSIGGRAVATGLEKLGVTDLVKGAVKPGITGLAEKYGAKMPLSSLTDSPVAKLAETFAGTESQTAADARKVLAQAQKDAAAAARTGDDAAKATADAAIKQANETIQKETTAAKEAYQKSSEAAKAKLAETTAAAEETFKQTSQAIANKITPENVLPKEGVGALIKQGFSAFQDAWEAAKTGLYNAISDHPLAKTMAANVDNSVAALQEIIAQEEAAGAAGSPALINYFKGILEDLKPEPQTVDSGFVNAQGEKISYTEPVDPKTFEDLKSIRSKIGKKTRSMDVINTGDKGLYDKLYGSLSEDLKATAKSISPEFDSLYQKANSVYREGINLINGKLGRALERVNPENIVKYFIKPFNATNLNILRGIVGDEAMATIGNDFLATAVQKSLDTEGMLDITKLQKYVGKFDEPTLSAILTPEQLATLKESLTKGSAAEFVMDAMLKEAKATEAAAQDAAKTTKTTALENAKATRNSKINEAKTAQATAQDTNKVALDQTTQEVNTLKDSLATKSGPPGVKLGWKLLAELGFAPTHPVAVVLGFLGDRAFTKWVLSDAGRASLLQDFSVSSKQLAQLIRKINATASMAAAPIAQAGNIKKKSKLP